MPRATTRPRARGASVSGNGLLPHVESVAVTTLVPASYNPRIIKNERYQQLKQNLKADPAFFAQRPCLVNRRDGQLIVYAGNQRLAAAKDLGLTAVPCLITEIPLALERERNIKDNRQEGDWNRDLLALNFTLDELRTWGFQDQELAGIYDNVEVEEDAGPGGLPQTPETQRGQLFTLTGQGGGRAPAPLRRCHGPRRLCRTLWRAPRAPDLHGSALLGQLRLYGRELLPQGQIRHRWRSGHVER